MMRPQRARIIFGTTRLHSRQVAVRFVLTTSPKSASDMRTRSPSRVMPALATSTSTAPSSSSTRVTAASTWSGSVTSHFTASSAGVVDRRGRSGDGHAMAGRGEGLGAARARSRGCRR